MARNGSPESVKVELAAPAPTGDLGRELLAQHRRLLMYAKLLVSDTSTAEDLVQDTLERALRASHNFRSGSNAGAWLTRIMRNLFTDRYRHKVAVREVSLESFDCWLPAPKPCALTYLDVVSSNDVLAALADLDVGLRELFVLRHVDGLSYEKLAARFDIPASTVGTRLRRVRLRLRRIIQERLATDRSSVVLSFARRDDP